MAIMSNQKDVGTLSGIGLLSDLPRDVLSSVEKSCSWRRYSAGEQIIDRQSDSRDVFFVVEGEVRVVNFSLSGREITLDDLGRGGHFGELAALDGAPRSASVMALKNCLVASLAPEKFITLLKESPEVAHQIMLDMAGIIRTATDRIMDLSTLAANNRVQAELLRQARANMTGDNTAAISPIPVHGDIAGRVSTTRETVARVMSDLARQNILMRGKDSLEVLDVDRLAAMVEEVRGD